MSRDLKQIWNSNTDTNSVVTTFNNNFNTHSTSVLTSLDRIDKVINNIYYKFANMESISQISNTTNNGTTGTTPVLVPVNPNGTQSVAQSPTPQLVPVGNGNTSNTPQLFANENLVLIPKLDVLKNITPNNTTNGNLSINIENINLDNVTNAKEFSSSLVNAIQTDKKVVGALQAKLINPLVGKSTKK